MKLYTYIFQHRVMLVSIANLKQVKKNVFIQYTK